MNPRIRIESDGMGYTSRVFKLNKDGTETEISDCVTGVDVRINVGDVNTASLEVLVVGGNVKAELEDLIVRHCGNSRLRSLAWRLKRLWWAIWFKRYV